jgi:hypothetical protein
MLGLWAKQGGENSQRSMSRLDDMGRFKELFQSLNGLLPQAMFRAELNPMAAEPLSILPNKRKHPDTGILPLALTNGHDRHIAVTAERALASVGECPLNI